MKLYALARNRILRSTVGALAALSIGGCSGAQDSTYSLVSQKMVGASDAVAPAQEPTATAPIPAGQSELALTAEEKKANNLIGVWEGTTRASCQALMRFAVLVDEDAEQAAHAERIGTLSLALNDPLSAVRWYEKSQVLSAPNADMLARLADAHLRMGQVEAAQATLDRALAKDDKNAAVRALARRLQR